MKSELKLKVIKIKYLYLFLCIIGFILPYSQLIPILFNGEFGFQFFINQLFINRVSTLFAFDLFITAIVFIIFTFNEGLKLKIKNIWIPLLFTFVVGASFGFPLFLYMREKNLEKNC